MGDFCTLIISDIEYEKAAKLLLNYSGSEISGNDDLWSNIKFQLAASSIKFSSLVREKPGDKFSQTVMGMGNLFNRIETQHQDVKKEIVKKIGNCQWMIGVVAEPAFSETDKHFDMIFSLATELNAIIFNGDSMIDAKGKLMLNKNGETENYGAL